MLLLFVLLVVFTLLLLQLVAVVDGDFTMMSSYRWHSWLSCVGVLLLFVLVLL